MGHSVGRARGPAVRHERARSWWSRVRCTPCRVPVHLCVAAKAVDTEIASAVSRAQAGPTVLLRRGTCADARSLRGTVRASIEVAAADRARAAGGDDRDRGAENPGELWRTPPRESSEHRFPPSCLPTLYRPSFGSRGKEGSSLGSQEVTGGEALTPSGKHGRRQVGARSPGASGNDDSSSGRSSGRAVRASSTVAAAAVARLVAVADGAARPAVVAIGLGVRANPSADVEPGRALALAAHAALAARTSVAARSAVRRISVDVDACASARRRPGAAVGAADAGFAHLIGRACVSAGPTVLGIGAELHAGTATIGDSATPSAHGRASTAAVAADLAGGARHTTRATVRRVCGGADACSGTRRGPACARASRTCPRSRPGSQRTLCRTCRSSLGQ